MGAQEMGGGGSDPGALRDLAGRVQALERDVGYIKAALWPQAAVQPPQSIPYPQYPQVPGAAPYPQAPGYPYAPGVPARTMGSAYAYPVQPDRGFPPGSPPAGPRGPDPAHHRDRRPAALGTSRCGRALRCDRDQDDVC